MLLPALIILRGLPGSGKSSLAKLLSENKYPVYSVDDFFTDDNGKYEFRFADNHLAYASCLQRTEQSMKDGISKIYIDNTFTMQWEMDPYIKLAEKYNYHYFVLTVENRGHFKNVHAVSDDQIEKMAEKFQVILY